MAKLNIMKKKVAGLKDEMGHSITSQQAKAIDRGFSENAKVAVSPYQMEMAQKEKDAEIASKTAAYKAKAKEAINGFVPKKGNLKLRESMKTVKPAGKEDIKETIFSAKFKS